MFLAGLLQPLLIAARTYPDVDRSRHWIVHDFGLYLLDQPLPADAVIVAVGEIPELDWLPETIDRVKKYFLAAGPDGRTRRTRTPSTSSTDGHEAPPRRVTTVAT